MNQTDYERIINGEDFLPKNWSYETKTIDLTVARVNEKYDRAGNIIHLKSITDAACGFSIRLDTTGHHLLPLFSGDIINVPNGFDKIFFTNAVGVGNADLVIGKNIDFKVRERAIFNTIRTALNNQVVVLGAAVATPIPAVVNQLADRVTMIIYNITGANLYIGNAAVTNVNGYFMPAATSLSLDVEQGVIVYGYSILGGNIRVLEGS